MRVSDEEVAMVINDIGGWSVTGEAWEMEEQLALDLRDARALLREYEAWEADVVLNGDWSAATVRLTQEQHDWLTQISIRRNKLLGNIDERGEPGG